jgi:hypothetical protein
MAPERPRTVYEAYDRLIRELRMEYNLPEGFDEALEDSWHAGTRRPCIDLIRQALVRDRGLTHGAIARKVRCGRATVADLLNHYNGSFALIRRIMRAFGLAMPSDRDRRIAGHCSAIADVRKTVLDEDVRNPLDPEEYVALYYLFKSWRWFDGSGELSTGRREDNAEKLAGAGRQLGEAVREIVAQVREYFGPGYRGAVAESIAALQDLVWEWGDAYLIHLPEVDPDWECES